MADYLECSHCGGVAIEADSNGDFWDGDVWKCEECGFPGYISTDGAFACWVESDCLRDVCEDPECRKCIRPARRWYQARRIG